MTMQVNLNIIFPEEELDNQWIIDLIDCLRFACQKVLGSGIVCNIQTVDLQKFQVNIISSTHYHFLILGTESNDNVAFQELLTKICSQDYSGGAGMNPFSKLFKVLLRPNENITQPGCLKPFFGHEFFNYSPGGSTTTLYDMGSQITSVWSKVLDVVYDLKQEVYAALNPEESPRYAYMAQCGFDQINHFYDIKRELQHFGIHVLPVEELPAGTEEMKSAMGPLLDASFLIIQIIGERYGKVSKGDKISKYEKENNIIQDFLKEHPHVYRIIWKPSDLRLTDSRQGLYLNRLMKDGSASNSSIIDATSEEFKDIIARKVNNPSRIDNHLESGAKVYLMCGDPAMALPFKKVASALNIQLLMENDPGTDNLYLDHLTNLGIAHGVIIYYPGGMPRWLNSKLGDIIKVIGMGREEPITSIAIFSPEKPEISEYMKWLPDIDFFNRVDSQTIEGFMKKIQIV
jgi:hypothetical protein